MVCQSQMTFRISSLTSEQYLFFIFYFGEIMEKKIITLDKKGLDYIPFSIEGVLKQVKGYQRGKPEFSAFARFLGVYNLTRTALQGASLFQQGDPTAKDLFIEMYSLYIGAVEGANLLHSDENGHKIGGNSEVIIDFHYQTRDSQARRDLILSDVLQSYVNAIRYLPEESRKTCTFSFLRNILNRCLEEKDKLRNKELFERGISSLELRVNGSIFYGFNSFTEREKIVLGTRCLSSSSLPYAVDMNLHLDDIIGNEDLKSKLMQSVHKILSYDPEIQQNPFKRFPQKFLIYGFPGTGKTETIKAVIAEGSRVAEKNGIELKVRNVLGSDFRSAYVSESERNLRAILEEMQNGNNSYILVIEDIDTLFTSRQETKSEERKSIFGEFINHLQGLNTRNKGNYLLITTTNRPRDLDAALARRLAEEEVQVYGPQTKDEFLLLFKKKLGIYTSYLTFTQEDWGNFGNLIMEEAAKFRSLDKDRIFSGGDITNISKRVIAAIDNIEFNDKWFALKGEERLREVQKRRRSLSFSAADSKPGLQGIVLDYVRSEIAKKKKEEEAKIEQMAREIQLHQLALAKAGVQ